MRVIFEACVHKSRGPAEREYIGGDAGDSLGAAEADLFMAKDIQ